MRTARVIANRHTVAAGIVTVGKVIMRSNQAIAFRHLRQRQLIRHQKLDRVAIEVEFERDIIARAGFDRDTQLQIIAFTGIDFEHAIIDHHIGAVDAAAGLKQGLHRVDIVTRRERHGKDDLIRLEAKVLHA